MTNEMLTWCAAKLGVPVDALGELVPVAGDASFRRYFRLTLPTGASLILMDAPPDKEDSRPFLDVAYRLREAGVLAPQILHSNLGKGWILLEDFGDTLYKRAFEETTPERLFTGIFDVLGKQAREVSAEGLPVYDALKLQSELDLFPDWYLAQERGAPFSGEERAHWKTLCEALIRNAEEQPQVFVHRDFHSCNLMVIEDAQPGVIDFQDAVVGPITYDLMSILLDRYITWPRAKLETWMEQFRLQVAPEVDTVLWQRWCDWTGLQRNLKIIGIFARLAHRDGKENYLALIPRFADYVRDVLQRYPELSPYRELLESRL